MKKIFTIFILTLVFVLSGCSDSLKAGNTITISEKEFSDYKVRLDFTFNRDYSEGDEGYFGACCLYLTDKSGKEIANSNIATGLSAQNGQLFIPTDNDENRLEVLSLNDNGESRYVVMLRELYPDGKTHGTFYWYNEDKNWFTVCDRIDSENKELQGGGFEIPVSDDFKTDEGMSCIDNTYGYKITFDFDRYYAKAALI